MLEFEVVILRSFAISVNKEGLVDRFYSNLEEDCAFTPNIETI